jgi:transaldolase
METGMAEKTGTKKKNPLLGLDEIGQSVWLDYLSRDLIETGALQRLIKEDAVTGVTSNPTIFQKAISASSLYDSGLQDMLHEGIREEKELFLRLAMQDVSVAAGMLLSVYQSRFPFRGAQDGFVSIEVSPELAYDTEATIKEARHIFNTLEKKNIYVKVPGTRRGLPAIEELISEGVNVNVTLLFSVPRYVEVMEAYLKGIERAIKAGRPVNETVSVASFFVSRVDTLVDKLLGEKIQSEKVASKKEGLKGLMGRSGVANSKIAYRKYREFFSSGRFLALKDKGAQVQKILWASTGTKNPAYSDIKYVEELEAPDSVNTMPEHTLKAFKDHGTIKVSIEEGVEEAKSLFRELKAAGIDIDEVTALLEEEGVKLFDDSYKSVLQTLSAKRDSFLAKKA